MDEMLELFSVMKEEKIPLTVEIFNIIISAHSKRGKMRRAFKFYNDVSWFTCLFSLLTSKQCRSKGRGRGGAVPPQFFFLKSKNRPI